MSLFQRTRPLIRIFRSHFIFLKILALTRSDYRRRVLNQETDLIIEGSPRCGNSFFNAYFRLSNIIVNPNIAHHTHTPAQVKEGVKRGIPIIIVIRAPLPAAISMKLRSPDLPLSQIMIDYIQFNSVILKHHKCIVIADFDIAVNSPEKIVKEFNSKYKSNYLSQELTPEFKARIFEELSLENTSQGKSSLAIASPHADKDKLKFKIKNKIENNQKLSKLNTKATAIYSEILTLSSTT